MCRSSDPRLLSPHCRPASILEAATIRNGMALRTHATHPIKSSAPRTATSRWLRATMRFIARLVVQSSGRTCLTIRASRRHRYVPEHQTELLEILAQIFEDHTCLELISCFRAAGVPCSPINSYSEALADPQVDFMGWVQSLVLPSGAETRTFVSPLKFSGEGFPIYRDPPALGEHNDEFFGADVEPIRMGRIGS